MAFAVDDMANDFVFMSAHIQVYLGLQFLFLTEILYMRFFSFNPEYPVDILN